ncbi:MAG TPA: DNRLRE domain-containing protein [Polyangiaceae bacterium]|nr:DNRLRE domain-containing protein [Polyangiaceae bacterium]
MNLAANVRMALGWTVLALAATACGATGGSPDQEGVAMVGEVQQGLTYQVGPGKPYANLQAVIGSLQPGDVVQVSGDATYSGDVRVSRSGTASSPIKIVGVVVNGKRPVLSGGTNTIELAGNYLILEGFDITNGSSRCVYHHGNQITVRGNVIHDCPSHGLLGADTGSGSLTLEYNEIYRCGASDRRHQVYMATDETAFPGSVFRMQYNYVHDGNGGNNVKSRAERNEIYYNWIEGAYFHELELIGPDGQQESLKREDSDVVGNVLYQGYTARSHPAIRIGGDGTGQTWGRYRFLNNTVVMGNASTSAAFRLFDGIESVEMHNNALYRQGGAAVTVLTDADAKWKSGRQIAGRNNWVTTGSTGIPSTWTATLVAANPGFVSVGSRDLTLSSTSALRDTGTSNYPSPSSFPFPSPLPAAAFEPPPHVLLALGSAIPRAPVGVVDIGAFEYGNLGVPPPLPPPPPPSTSPVTLHPTEDTFIRNGTYANNNFGALANLDVKMDTEPNLTRDAYLRFDLSNLPSVSSAKFRVYAALSLSDTVTATLYPVTGSWAESTLTWNTAPGFVATSPLGSLSATTSTYAWKEIDVGNFVRSEYAAGRRLISVALHCSAASTEKMIINSSEASSNQPELVVAP